MAAQPFRLGVESLRFRRVATECCRRVHPTADYPKASQIRGVGRRRSGAALEPRRKSIVNPVLARQAAPALDSASGVGGQGGRVASSVLALFGQSQMPLPRQSNHFLNSVRLAMSALEAAKHTRQRERPFGKTIAMNDARSWARAEEENGVGMEAISIKGPPLPGRFGSGNQHRPGIVPGNS